MQRCEFCRNYMKQQTWRKEEGCYLSSTTLHTGKCRYYRLRDDTVEDMRDAAEFEARVAALLAKRNDLFPYCTLDCFKKWHIPDANYVYCARDIRECKLREARITVEQEMDG